MAETAVKKTLAKLNKKLLNWIYFSFNKGFFSVIEKFQLNVLSLIQKLISRGNS